MVSLRVETGPMRSKIDLVSTNWCLRKRKVAGTVSPRSSVLASHAWCTLVSIPSHAKGEKEYSRDQVRVICIIVDGKAIGLCTWWLEREAGPGTLLFLHLKPSSIAELPGVLNVLPTEVLLKTFWTRGPEIWVGTVMESSCPQNSRFVYFK